MTPNKKNMFIWEQPYLFFLLRWHFRFDGQYEVRGVISQFSRILIDMIILLQCNIVIDVTETQHRKKSYFVVKIKC